MLQNNLQTNPYLQDITLTNQYKYWMASDLGIPGGFFLRETSEYRAKNFFFFYSTLEIRHLKMMNIYIFEH